MLFHTEIQEATKKPLDNTEKCAIIYTFQLEA